MLTGAKGGDSSGSGKESPLQFKKSTKSTQTVPKPKRLKESEYVVPGADNRGRSDSITFRTLPGYARLMEEILAERKFPFRTNGDLLRWAFAHGLEHLTKVEPPATSLMAYVTNQVRKLRDEMYQFEQLQDVELLEEVVRHHLRLGTDANKLHALGLVVQAITEAGKIKDGVWRKSLVTELQTKFDHVLKMKDEVERMVKVVSIHPTDYTEDEETDVVDTD